MEEWLNYHRRLCKWNLIFLWFFKKRQEDYALLCIFTGMYVSFPGFKSMKKFYSKAFEQRTKGCFFLAFLW